MSTTNNEYWENASVNTMLMTEKGVLEYETYLEDFYITLLQDINRELSYCFNTYGKNGKLLFSDLRIRLSENEYKKFKKEIKTILDSLDINIITKEFINSGKKLYERKTATLLEYINFRIYYYIIKMAIKQYEETLNLLAISYGAAYYTHLFNYAYGVKKEIEFIPVNEQNITLASKAIIDNTATIDRVYYSSKQLYDKLSKDIQQRIAMGYSVDRIVDSVEKIIHTRFNYDKGNIRTSATFVNNKANEDMIKNVGADTYEYIAILDERTTEQCKSLNGKEFKISEARVGVNLPPLHINCRSSISIKITETLKKSLNSLPMITRNTTINKWLKNKIPKEQQKILNYIDKYYK